MRNSNPFFEYVEQLKSSEEIRSATISIQFENLMQKYNQRSSMAREKKIIPSTMTMDKESYS